MNSHIKKTALLLLALTLPFLTGASTVAQDNIRLGISSQESYVGVPVSLSIAIENADATDEPELPEVEGLDIRLAGTPSRSSRVSIINGRRSESRSVTYSFRITPRREGTFEIPSFTIKTAKGNSQTEPIRIVSTKSETGDLLFAEVSGQKEKLYVGQPIDLTLKIWLRPFEDRKLGVKLSNADMFRMMSEQTEWGAFQNTIESLAEDENAVRSRQVLRADSSGQEHSYYLYEMDATFYPKRAGELAVDDVQIVVNYPTQLGKSRDPFGSFFDDSMFGNNSPFNDDFFRDRFSGFGNRLTVTDSRPIVATPEVAPIEVVPIPSEGRPSDYRGAVGKYNMITQAEPTHVKAGDPINLKIGIRGTGPMELVQSPPLAELSSLTADFKVSDEPLAGVVQDDIKVFATTIRPRREGITQIPAIPFSFFDSDEEKFVTVMSDPISIQVDKAEKLGLDSIVGSGGKRDTGSQTATAQAGPVFNNFTDRGALETTSAPDFGFWISLLALPPVLLCVFLFLRNRGGQGTGILGSRRAALAKINRATETRQISLALLSAIAHRLGRPTSNMTRPEAITSLSGIADSSTIEQLDQFLTRCENAAFAGGELELGELKSEGRGLVRKLGQVRPIRQARRISVVKKPWRFAAATLFGACLVAATTWSTLLIFQSSQTPQVASLHPAALIQLDENQKMTLLDEANAAYDKAMESKSTDAAEASQAFADSARKYQTLVDAGVSNYKMYFNLGNAYLQSDSMGRAIANYRRAAKLRPLASAPRRNFEFAQQIAGKDLPTETSSTAMILSQAKDWLSRLPSMIWLTLLAIGWFGVYGAWFAKQTRTTFKTRYVMVPAAALLLAVTGWLAYNSQLEAPLPAAVAVVDELPVYQGSSEAFPPLTNLKINEGDSVEVLQRRGDWLQFRSVSGQQGWAKAALLEQV